MVPEPRLPSERPPSAVPFGLPSAAFWAERSLGEDRSGVNTKYNYPSIQQSRALPQFR